MFLEGFGIGEVLPVRRLDNDDCAELEIKTAWTLTKRIYHNRMISPNNQHWSDFIAFGWLFAAAYFPLSFVIRTEFEQTMWCTVVCSGLGNISRYAWTGTAFVTSMVIWPFIVWRRKKKAIENMAINHHLRSGTWKPRILERGLKICSCEGFIIVRSPDAQTWPLLFKLSCHMVMVKCSRGACFP